MSVPFGERGGRLRGGLDLIAGRYPRFVFGGRVGRLLPVFHFHDERPDDFERKLQYLATNRYRTVNADDMAAFIQRRPLPERAVALCFDDAWASVWTSASVLLKRYGFQAILYAIPGRTDDAEQTRSRESTVRSSAVTSAYNGSPFATWPELRALHEEGSFDIQSHTFSHAMIHTASAPIDFVAPGYEESSFLSRPLVDAVESAPHVMQHVSRTDQAGIPLGLPGEHTHSRPIFVTPADLGTPLYATRSRMSEAPRVTREPAVRAACVRLVVSEGGPTFFARTDWRARLEATAAAAGSAGHRESDAEQQRAIESEIDTARTELNARLRTNTVNHVCLPWGISGRQTKTALRRLGIHTAIANRMPGVFAVRPGDDPYWLKRLPNKYIYRLPGEGRRWWFTSTR